MPEHFIPGKDASLEASIARMQSKLAEIGFQVEERSWLHPVDGLWSVHIADRDCPLLFTNGKGASQLAAQASALGEFFERLSTNYFWSHYYFGAALAAHRFVHHPEERWFEPGDDGQWPPELLTPELRGFYDPDGSITAETLVDRNSGNRERGARGQCRVHAPTGTHLARKRIGNEPADMAERELGCEQGGATFRPR